jgi:putative FmdB family regulatory protein
MCDACQKEFELEQRISEPPISKCPKCGKKKAHRVITNGNFILKGGGWYSDGYSAKHASSLSSSKTDSSSKSSVTSPKESSSTSAPASSAKTSNATSTASAA